MTSVSKKLYNDKLDQIVNKYGSAYHSIQQSQSSPLM